MFAVCVSIALKPDYAAQFMPLMLENAQQTRATEPGCQQFDVTSNTSHPDQIFLYEIYDDRAAFDAHLASAHFRSFDAATAAMIAAKSVQTFDTVQR
ncbi:MAG: putative quinol monooxygenase [Pseudomonadota bacterium]